MLARLGGSQGSSFLRYLCRVTKVDLQCLGKHANAGGRWGLCVVFTQSRVIRSLPQCSRLSSSSGYPGDKKEEGEPAPPPSPHPSLRSESSKEEKATCELGNKEENFYKEKPEAPSSTLSESTSENTEAKRGESYPAPPGAESSKMPTPAEFPQDFDSAPDPTSPSSSSSPEAPSPSRASPPLPSPPTLDMRSILSPEDFAALSSFQRDDEFSELEDDLGFFGEMPDFLEEDMSDRLQRLMWDLQGLNTDELRKTASIARLRTDIELLFIALLSPLQPLFTSLQPLFCVASAGDRLKLLNRFEDLLSLDIPPEKAQEVRAFLTKISKQVLSYTRPGQGASLKDVISSDTEARIAWEGLVRGQPTDLQRLVDMIHDAKELRYRLQKHKSRQPKKPGYKGAKLRRPASKKREKGKASGEAEGAGAASEVPSVDLKDYLRKEFGLAGLEEGSLNPLRRVMIERRFLSPAERATIGLRSHRGILIEGPPGCGKTSLARALGPLLGSSEENVKIVYGPDVQSKWYGESEKNLKEVFDQALQRVFRVPEHPALQIIILDEIEALAPVRGRDSNHRIDDGMVTVLLSSLDGAREFTPSASLPGKQPPPSHGNPLDYLLVVGTTNRPDAIDPALLRFGRMSLRLQLKSPTEEGRLDILLALTERLEKASLLSEGAKSELKMYARKSRNFSGADLQHFIQEALSLALDRAMHPSEEGEEEELKEGKKKKEKGEEKEEEEAQKAVVQKGFLSRALITKKLLQLSYDQVSKAVKDRENDAKKQENAPKNTKIMDDYLATSETARTFEPPSIPPAKELRGLVRTVPKALHPDPPRKAEDSSALQRPRRKSLVPEEIGGCEGPVGGEGREGRGRDERNCFFCFSLSTRPRNPAAEYEIFQPLSDQRRDTWEFSKEGGLHVRRPNKEEKVEELECDEGNGKEMVKHYQVGNFAPSIRVTQADDIQTNRIHTPQVDKKNRLTVESPKIMSVSPATLNFSESRRLRGGGTQDLRHFGEVCLTAADHIKQEVVQSSRGFKETISNTGHALVSDIAFSTARVGVELAVSPSRFEEEGAVGVLKRLGAEVVVCTGSVGGGIVLAGGKLGANVVESVSRVGGELIEECGRIGNEAILVGGAREGSGITDFGRRLGGVVVMSAGRITGQAVMAAGKVSASAITTASKVGAEVVNSVGRVGGEIIKVGSAQNPYLKISNVDTSGLTNEVDNFGRNMLVSAVNSYIGRVSSAVVVSGGHLTSEMVMGGGAIAKDTGMAVGKVGKQVLLSARTVGTEVFSASYRVSWIGMLMKMKRVGVKAASLAGVGLRKLRILKRKKKIQEQIENSKNGIPSFRSESTDHDPIRRRSSIWSSVSHLNTHNEHSIEGSPIITYESAPELAQIQHLFASVDFETQGAISRRGSVNQSSVSLAPPPLPFLFRASEDSHHADHRHDITPAPHPSEPVQRRRASLPISLEQGDMEPVHRRRRSSLGGLQQLHVPGMPRRPSRAAKVVPLLQELDRQASENSCVEDLRSEQSAGPEATSPEPPTDGPLKMKSHYSEVSNLSLKDLHSIPEEGGHGPDVSEVESKPVKLEAW